MKRNDLTTKQIETLTAIHNAQNTAYELSEVLGISESAARARVKRLVVLGLAFVETHDHLGGLNEYHLSIEGTTIALAAARNREQELDEGSEEIASMHEFEGNADPEAEAEAFAQTQRDGLRNEAKADAADRDGLRKTLALDTCPCGKNRLANPNGFCDGCNDMPTITIRGPGGVVVFYGKGIADDEPTVAAPKQETPTATWRCCVCASAMNERTESGAQKITCADCRALHHEADATQGYKVQHADGSPHAKAADLGSVVLAECMAATKAKASALNHDHTKKVTKKDAKTIAKKATAYGCFKTKTGFRVTCPRCRQPVEAYAVYGKEAGVLLRAELLDHLTRFGAESECNENLEEAAK